MRFQENVLLSKHTTFRIGGPAKYFCIARNKEDLIKAVKKAKELKLPFFILGGGSNVLALDKGYNGIVIKVQSSKLKISPYGGSPEGRHNSEIYAEAGVKLEDIVKLSDKKSLTGMEWAAGIPGTVGGAVYGNAQAFDIKMSDIIKSVEVLNAGTLEIKSLNKKDCQFLVKNSIFKKNKNLIILLVVLSLEEENKEKIQKEIKEHLSIRKQRHLLSFPSAGSIFINKAGGLPSSYLIEKAGLKGVRVGGAKVSKKHAGFIVNTGKAKAGDVLKLIKIIKQKVKSKFGIDLEEEIQIIK